MTWTFILAQGGPGTTSVTPVDTATNSFLTYILSFGAIGVFLLVLSWLFWKGWRLVSPAKDAERQAKEDENLARARTEARADLLDQIARLERQAEQAQRDKKAAEDALAEQQKFAQVQLIPLLVNFTNATSALIPLLQGLVQHQEGGGGDGRRR